MRQDVDLVVLEGLLVHAEVIAEHLLILGLGTRIVPLEIEEHHGVLQGLECSGAYEMLIRQLEVVVFK